MNDLVETIDTYLSAWNETDPSRRSTLIAAVWAGDGRLIDPPIAAEGHEKICEMMSALHAHYPGHRFRRASGIDTHHDHLRFAWELVAPDGAVAIAGLDVGELTPDGLLRRITGFFGPLPVDAPSAQRAS